MNLISQVDTGEQASAVTLALQSTLTIGLPETTISDRGYMALAWLPLSIPEQAYASPLSSESGGILPKLLGRQRPIGSWCLSRHRLQSGLVMEAQQAKAAMEFSLRNGTRLWDWVQCSYWASKNGLPRACAKPSPFSVGASLEGQNTLDPLYECNRLKARTDLSLFLLPATFMAPAHLFLASSTNDPTQKKGAWKLSHAVVSASAPGQPCPPDRLG